MSEIYTRRGFFDKAKNAVGLVTAASVAEAVAKTRPATELIAAGTSLIIAGRNNRAEAQCACGGCEPHLGQPKCEGICPDQRKAVIEVLGGHFEDSNNNNRFDKEAGERFVSSVKGGRFMEVQAWGCEDRIKSIDPRNKNPRLRRLIAHEGGNGIGIDIETGNPFVGFMFDGAVEDWIDGIDKADGVMKKLPIIRFQFRWYADNFREIIVDKVTGKPYTWEGCAFLCPLDEEPTLASYYIGTAKTRAELAALGLTYAPDTMAQPRYNPKGAVLTADLR